jgi:hypothetical protein
MVSIATLNPKAAIPEPFRRNRGGAFNFQNAMLMDGVNDECFTNALNGVPFTDFCYSFWFKRNPALTGVIVSTNGLSNANNLRIGLTALAYDLFLQNSAGGNMTSVPTFGFNSIDWQHIVFQGDFANKRIEAWINGTRVFSITTVGLTWFTSFGRLDFGSAAGAAKSGGTFDEAALFYRFLSDREILTIYNNGIGSNSFSLDALQAYWKFNETGSPATAADSSGNGNNLTLLNGPTFVPH